MADFDEVISAPYTVYIAPEGTTMPAIDDAEGDFAAGWVKLGTNGNLNYTEDGVGFDQSQDVESIFSVGTTAPIQASRTREGLVINFSLMDVSLEQYDRILRGAGAQTTRVVDTPAGAGTAGYRTMDGLRGSRVAKFAVLARGLASAYGETFNAQYQVYRAFQSANQNPVYRKGPPATLAVALTALYDIGEGTTHDIVMGDAVAA